MIFERRDSAGIKHKVEVTVHKRDDGGVEVFKRLLSSGYVTCVYLDAGMWEWVLSELYRAPDVCDCGEGLHMRGCPAAVTA